MIVSLPRPKTARAALLCALALGGCRERPGTASQTLPDTTARAAQASPGGTGRVYLGREIAQPLGHGEADWFERPDRETTEFPSRVLDALRLADTLRIADVGAGTGYFTFRIAPRVPRGRVFAVDIDPAMLDSLSRRRDRLGVHHVEVVRGTVADPGLDSASVDVVLIVDSYHEFSEPEAMGRALVRALRPGGRLVLVEYRAEDETLAIDPLHRMSAAQMRTEMAALGLRQLDALDVLPQQHLLVFGR